MQVLKQQTSPTFVQNDIVLWDNQNSLEADLYRPKTISNKTADYAVQTADMNGKNIFTNEGALGLITFTLPTMTAGLQTTIINTSTNFGLNIVCTLGDLIWNPSLQQYTTYLSIFYSDTIEIYGISNHKWFVNINQKYRRQENIFNLEQTGADRVITDFRGLGWAWGINSSGAVGDNSATARSVPTAVCMNYTFKQVSMGIGFALGIDAVTGKAWAWGLNSSGQLGDNSVTSRRTPIAVCLDYTFNQLSAGGTFSFGIDAVTGKLWSWGASNNGQLGDNQTATSRSTPVAVCLDFTYKQVTGGISHALGIDAVTGKAWAWGLGTTGQLGINAVTNVCRLTPVAVCLDYTFAQVHAGNTNSAGLDFQGKAYAWGTGGSGQVGDNQIAANRSTPVAVALNLTYIQLAGGYAHVLGLDYKGQIWGWGINAKGAIGDNAVACRSTPVATASNFTFVQISATSQTSIALDYKGQLWGWGDNASGVLGDKSTVCRSLPVAICLQSMPMQGWLY